MVAVFRNVPGAHSTLHVAIPSALVVFPKGHVEQEARPAVAVILPSGQFVHTSAVWEEEYLPGRQLVQSATALDPVVAVDLPLPQGVHDPTPPAE